MEVLEELLITTVELAILLFEFSGVIILVYAGIVGLYQYIRKAPDMKLKLAKGMSMGLEFKLGSEILRTVIARDYKDILIAGGIIILRAALTFLIHWEIKNEEMHCVIDEKKDI